MEDYQVKYITPEIKLSCYNGKLFKTEVAFNDHMLVWFISGETKIIQADQNYLFKTGDIFLIPRNQLATIINYPKDGLPHKSVAMHLSIDRLRKFYANLNVKPKVSATPKIRSFSKHPLLESCLASLIPYFDVQDKFTLLARCSSNKGFITHMQASDTDPMYLLAYLCVFKQKTAAVPTGRQTDTNEFVTDSGGVAFLPFTGNRKP